MVYISTGSSSASQRTNILHDHKNLSELFHDTVLFPVSIYSIQMYYFSPLSQEKVGILRYSIKVRLRVDAKHLGLHVKFG